MNTTFISILTSAAAAMALHGAATTPVGYTTETFKAGQFNVFGLTLHSSVLATGAIDTIAGTTLTDNEVDFDAVLTPGTTYILEITSGTWNGRVQAVTTWTGNDLTTPDDLSADLVENDTYQIRAAKTIAEVFGAANESGLLAGSVTTADVLWIPDGIGGFSKFYYAQAAPPFVTAGWKKSGAGNTNQGSEPIMYTSGLILERRGDTDLDLVVTGEVKLTSSLIAVNQDYTYLGASFPAGVTLASSGLQSYVSAGSSTTADLLWFPDGSGSYNKYYYAVASPPFVTEGWKLSGGGNTDRGTVALPSGFFIEKRSIDFTAVISPPVVTP